MGDALILWGQLHIVAIGAVQVVIVASHCLIDTVFERQVYIRRHIFYRETALDAGASLCHVA